MTSGRSSLTMVVALLLAAVAAAGVYLYSNASQEEDATPAATIVPTPTEEPRVDALVATRDIEANTLVTADMVEVRQVLPQDRNVRAFASPDEVVGKYAISPLVEDEQILDSRIADAPIGDDQTGTFAFEVPTGHRAMAFTFDQVVGSGAMVQPGDRVDVIGYWEIDVTDPTFEESGQSAAIGNNNNDNDDNSDDTDTDTSDNNSDDDEVDYTQYLSAYVVQDVEVLFVAQAVTPDDAGVAGGLAEPTPTPTQAPTAEADSTATVVPTATTVGEPVPRPEAVSVTLALNPEQAQRMLLAAETVTHENDQAALRLSLRAPGDTSTVDLRPSQLGNIPPGELLGDANRPMIPSELAITDAEFTKETLTVGEELNFRVTVKNISDETITSAPEPPPGFVYTEGTAYDALGFGAAPDTYRLGLNVSGAYPNEFPYRWSLGRDLRPGESVEVTGSVKLTESSPSTQYWFGIILTRPAEWISPDGFMLDPDVVTQDGVGVTDVTVAPVTEVVVRSATAPLRRESAESSVVVTELRQGDRLAVLETDGDWFRVQTADKSEGWVAATDVEVVPAAEQGSAPAATPQATPES